MTINNFIIFFTAMHFWGLLGCVGIAVSRAWVFPSAINNLSAILVSWKRLWLFSLLLLTMGSLGLFIARGLNMLEGSDSWSDLLATHFAHISLLRFATLTLLWLTWPLMHQKIKLKSYDSFLLVIMGFMVFCVSATGHAAEQGDFSIGQIVDFFHVGAALTWGGIILVAAFIVLPHIKKEAYAFYALISEYVTRLSKVSGYALLIVVVTGIYNATHRLISIEQLWVSVYGRTLSFKLLLVVAMILLGAVNRFILVPRIQAWAKKGRIQNLSLIYFTSWAITLESVLALIILIIVANLIQLS